jgi:ATP synthase protein I
MPNFIMNEKEEHKFSVDGTPLSKKVGIQEHRKLKAKKRAIRNIWSGFAVFGLVGWSVAIPMIIGIILGVWLDNHYPGGRSWTLMLLVVGLFIGCLNAWHWVAEENRDMHNEDRPDE